MYSTVRVIYSPEIESGNPHSLQDKKLCIKNKPRVSMVPTGVKTKVYCSLNSSCASLVWDISTKLIKITFFMNGPKIIFIAMLLYSISLLLSL
jgi:hypothetical protein